MREDYQTAVLELLTTGPEPEAVIAGLRATLQKRGHQALLPSILAGVVRTLEASPQSEATLTIARESDREKYAQKLQATLDSLEVTEAPHTRIDSTIIGGFVLEADHQRVDHSFKHRLVQLYRNITT